MLLRSLGDEDDEVRDRAVLLVHTLSQLLPTPLSVASEDGGDAEDPAASALSPQEVQCHCYSIIGGCGIIREFHSYLLGGAALSVGRGPATVICFPGALS